MIRNIHAGGRVKRRLIVAAAIQPSQHKVILKQKNLAVLILRLSVVFSTKNQQQQQTKQNFYKIP